MKAVVVLAGEVEDTALLRRHLREADLVIAADGGAERLAALGVRPQVVIGDFDSLGVEAVERLRAAGVEVEVHPEWEQKTDGHVALLLARQRGAREVILAGVRGSGRLDHGLANLLYPLARAFRDLRVTAISDWSEAVALPEEGLRSVRFRGAVGDYVSLIPISETVTGVTTYGLRYRLRGHTLRLGESLGVSNELEQEEGGFDIAAGVAYAIHHFRQERLS